MNSHCDLCRSLGSKDQSDIGQSSARSREEIERHKEIHQSQIKLIMGDCSLEEVTKPKFAYALCQTKSGKGKVTIYNRSKDSKEWRSIKIHIHTIRSKHGEEATPFAKCNLCGNQARRYNNGNPDTPKVLLHISQHLPHRMFSCRRCEFRTKTIPSIYAHLSCQHRVNKRVRDHFEDTTDRYSTEIKRMITKCFDTPKWAQPLIVSDNHRTSDVAVTGRKRERQRLTRMDPLARIRHAHCRDLLRRAKADGGIECRKCRQILRFGLVLEPHAALNHVQEKHLHKATYRCLLCDCLCVSYEAIKRHFTWRHRWVTMSGNYENKENEFHEEILAELSACFDPDSGKNDRNSPLKIARLAPSTSKHAANVTWRIALVAKRSMQPQSRKDVFDFDEPSISGQHLSIRTSSSDGPRGTSDRNQCHLCGIVFKYGMVLTKHIALFHSQR